MLPERVAAVIIDAKQILLVTDKKADFFWTPGGKVEPGESHKAALGRELGEELNVVLTSFTPYIIYRTVNQVAGKTQFVHCYVVDIDGRPQPHGEITEYGWFTKKHLLLNKPLVSRGIATILLPQLIKDELL
ncbi:MAG: NUDIX domain-containing protein [Candidatus Poribacteria bacterium]